MSDVKLFDSHHFATPGYFRRQGSIYVLKIGDTYRMMAACGPPPFQAAWSMEGKMGSLRLQAERIIEANETSASMPEAGPGVQFTAMPNLPANIPRGNRRRRVVDTRLPHEIEKAAEVANTEREDAAHAPRRKVRKGKKASAKPAEAAADAVEGPAELATQPETSDNGGNPTN